MIDFSSTILLLKIETSNGYNQVKNNKFRSKHLSPLSSLEGENYDRNHTNLVINAVKENSDTVFQENEDQKTKNEKMNHQNKNVLCYGFLLVCLFT